MIEKRTWQEFADCKLLWLVNSTLHIFGWCIVVDGESAYPAKTDYRGFSEETNTKGYETLAERFLK